MSTRVIERRVSNQPLLVMEAFVSVVECNNLTPNRHNEAHGSTTKCTNVR